jgi:hypothetical protein
MQSPWLHRSAVLLAVAAFLLALTGATVTSNEERPLYSVGQFHLWLGGCVAFLTSGVALGMRASQQPWLRRLGRIALAVVAGLTFLGFLPFPQAPVVRIAHAFLAQVFIVAATALAFATSSGWDTAPHKVEGSPVLLVLAKLTPVVVLAQVALGTLYRHGVLDVGLHLAGAFVAAFLIMGLTLPVIYRPEFSSLHFAAKTVLTIAAVQVFVGMALLTMRTMDLDPVAIIVVTMVHTATGALTLAATVMLAVLVFRGVRPAPAAHAAKA